METAIPGPPGLTPGTTCVYLAWLFNLSSSLKLNHHGTDPSKVIVSLNDTFHLSTLQPAYNGCSINVAINILVTLPLVV